MITSSDHITGGFEIVPAVLDRHEIAVVASALQQAGVERSRAGARHLMRYPIVQPLARDPRLLLHPLSTGDTESKVAMSAKL